MATGHFPTGSHNFAHCGFTDQDQMATVTLQTTYDPTLSCVYPKVACPLEISSGSRINSDVVSHLPAAQHRRTGPPRRCVFRNVITRSRESRGHHYDAPFIFRVKKSLLPPNNAVFIATAIVVKDAADTPDDQGLGEHMMALFAFLRAPARCRLLVNDLGVTQGQRPQ